MFSTRTYHVAVRSSILLRSKPPFVNKHHVNMSTITDAIKKFTISKAIKRDHREIEEYYNEVINHPGNHDHQQRYANRFTWELARHAVAEAGRLPCDGEVSE